MQKWVYILRITRPLNLAIIAFTMWLMRQFVLLPYVEANGMELQLSAWQFLLLVLSTVLVAAGGNVINDYFDQRTDRINKPEDTLVGVVVKRREAMVVHQALSIAGVMGAFYVSLSIGNWKLVLVHIMATTGLWFYSLQFKRELIIGNVVIALLAAVVPLLVGLYEIPLLLRTYGAEIAEYFKLTRPGEDPSVYFKYLFYFIFGYAAFAFLLNLIREIQKDMADVKGDLRIGARTIPIVYGIRNAKKVTAVLIVFTIVLLLALQQMLVAERYSLLYLIAGVIAPLMASLWWNHFAVYRHEFVKAGNFLKLAMLGGLLYSIAHYYIHFTGT
jgi:4-hydroxybenzoate polyprenyltransferase